MKAGDFGDIKSSPRAGQQSCPRLMPFHFLPCQSDQKPPREWGNQVGELIPSANLLRTCQELGTRNKLPRPSAVHTAQEKRVFASKRRIWAPTGFTSSSISKNHFTLWLTATFGRFHTVSACFLVLTSPCEESSNWNSEQKSESRLCTFWFVCGWLVMKLTSF